MTYHIQYAPRPAPVVPVLPEPWMDGALCTQFDPAAWFPDGQGASNHEAKKICSSCDVKAECLTYALEHHEEFGVWGGTSPLERRRMRSTS
jgi:WhiB family redox-sensing transcriptional regulator